MADLSRIEPIYHRHSAITSDWKLPAILRFDLGPKRVAMILDGLTVVASAVVACLLVLRYGGITHRTGLLEILKAHGRAVWVPAVLILGFALTIILNFERMHLYASDRLTSIFHEQRLILQACSTAGLLLASTVYLLHPKDLRTVIVVSTVGLTTIALSVRRLIARLFLYRSFRRGTGTRNVFIVGTGPTACALRNHLDNMEHLGYSFQGFIQVPGTAVSHDSVDHDIVGTLSNLFNEAQKRFVDEILFAAPCEREDVQRILSQARDHNVNIRLIPDLYDASVLNPPIEYLGQFPSIPLYRRQMPDGRLLLKRGLDIAISLVVLVLLAPLFLLIAIMIKHDSSGPVFYLSDRLGKKGRVFQCIKFRTMVLDAEKRRAGLMSMNERDGVLFKLENDPRITRVGRVLRKYSLDELPQFINVLRGDMSVVGPRPPLAGEVRQYKPGHLRRLDVTPGITGLWQVQARKDPSFDRYVSLDMTYIENWSIWLDLEIMFRTIGVMLAGTGS